MRKKILFLLLPVFLVILFSPALRVSADGAGRLVISDGADLLTEEEENSLQTVMEPILEYGCAGFCSVSTMPAAPSNVECHLA